MDLGLKGRRALVTGGTRGIGRAIALALAAEGVDVGLCARDGAAVAATVEALQARGVRAEGRALDVADGEALRAWVTETATRFGGLDILVANTSAMAEGATEAEFRKAFEVDVLHTLNAVTAALPFLARSAGGSIVAISSISGSEDYGYAGVSYGAMKAALLFYMKSLARHVAPQGIRANVVSPGTTYFTGGFWHEVEIRDPKGFAETLAENPMGRMARPEEIANAVVFLASDAASFVSGTNLVVDGTLTRRIQL
ncbi:MAG: SDR family NAD(P)-dependent oxidoreductase [Hyphomicrobiales bacterium]